MITKTTKWERTEGDKTERFRCMTKDNNGDTRLARLSRTRPSVRQANYAWRLLVDGFGNRHLGYYGDSEAMAKRHAQDMLKRMFVKPRPAQDVARKIQE